MSCFMARADKLEDGRCLPVGFACLSKLPVRHFFQTVASGDGLSYLEVQAGALELYIGPYRHAGCSKKCPQLPAANSSYLQPLEAFGAPYTVTDEVRDYQDVPGLCLFSISPALARMGKVGARRPCDTAELVAILFFLHLVASPRLCSTLASSQCTRGKGTLGNCPS